MAYVLGVDSSTTATKAVLVDKRGDVVGVGRSEYVASAPHPLWSEQSPELWWDATQAAIRSVVATTGVDPSTIVSVGLTGQMHGLVLLDEDNAPLRPAILWNDQRSAAECDEMRARIGRERMITITGNEALAGFTAPKLLWVRNHEPDVYSRVRHLLLPKDYVRLRLTGTYAMDRAGGGGTILFDHAARTWSPEILEALDIPADWVPPTFEGPEITGHVTNAAAAGTGLVPGTPVIAGGGDQAATAVGTGAVDPGVVTASLGTSGVVFAATDAPVIDPQGRVHAFPHAVPDRWHLMGVTLAAAGSLAWLRETVAPGVSFTELGEEAATVPPSSDGLLFLPYLSGERTPHPDPQARGAFVGLTTRHSRAHLVRAVMEGVAFSLRDVLGVMEAAGVVRPTQIRVSGGGANSQPWLEILAAVLGTEIATVTTTEGAAYGAAMLAAVGVGWFGSAHEAVEGWVRIAAVTSVGAATVTYDEMYGLYRDLYPTLRPTMHALG